MVEKGQIEEGGGGEVAIVGEKGETEGGEAVVGERRRRLRDEVERRGRWRGEKRG